MTLILPSLTSAPGEPQRERVYLQPGFLFRARRPTSIVTILGSCVTVCLWDGVRRTGAANHFLLPVTPLGEVPSVRYGDIALSRLIDEMLGSGSRVRDLTAQVYGGGNVIEAFRGQSMHLGLKNVDAARNALLAASIPVSGSDVGGNRGRKIAFDTWDGTTILKYV